MRAGAVLYVGRLNVMRAFYEACFALAATDVSDDFCHLVSDTWALTLVRSTAAIPDTDPAPRREGTPIKLAFSVASIDDLRQMIPGLGGRVDPADAEWIFRDTLRCDCLDPEGNVVQLVQTVGQT